MRDLVPTSRFKKDLKREQRGRYRDVIASEEFLILLEMLQRDETLPEKYRDHALGGNLAGCRDCHIRPDLLLIYEKPDAHTLSLIRLGSHAELDF